LEGKFSRENLEEKKNIVFAKGQVQCGGIRTAERCVRSQP
jgi:hypothetical protein